MTSLVHRASLERWFATNSGWSDAVLPDYYGGSIANLPATILRAFNVPLPEYDGFLPPLRDATVDPATLENAQVVIVIVVDGFSATAYQTGLLTGMLGGLPPAAGTITSVFPSTTAAALTSAHLGVAPTGHGMAGYTLYLPGHRRVVNMIHFKPVDGGSFTRPGPDPARFVSTPTVFARLAAAGIDSVVVSHREYAGSPLTKLHSGSTHFRGHRTLAEFVALLRIASDTPQRRFIFGYWAGLDMLSHTWGPESSEATSELTLLARALSEGLFAPLRRTRNDTVVLLTSDHGHRQLSAEQSIPIAGALRLSGGLRHPPTGERRAMGLSLRRPDQIEVFREMAGDSGVLINVGEALAEGLYGPPPLHPEVHERVGDWILLARSGATFHQASGAEKEPSFGAHGSLTADEMLVPLLVERFR